MRFPGSLERPTQRVECCQRKVKDKQKIVQEDKHRGRFGGQMDEVGLAHSPI